MAADEKDHLEERIYGFVDLVEMEMVVVVVDEERVMKAVDMEMVLEV